MAADYELKLDPKGLAEVLASDDTRAAVHEVAEEIAARARSTAPVDTGTYQNSIKVRSTKGKDGEAVEQVVADVRYAVYVEARTGNLSRSIGG